MSYELWVMSSELGEASYHKTGDSGKMGAGTKMESRHWRPVVLGEQQSGRQKDKRRLDGGDRHGFNTTQKPAQVAVERGGALHHGGVAAMVEEAQLGVGQQAGKLVGYRRRRDGIVQAPDEQHGLLNFMQLLA